MTYIEYSAEAKVSKKFAEKRYNNLVLNCCFYYLVSDENTGTRMHRFSGGACKVWSCFCDVVFAFFFLYFFSNSSKTIDS